MNTEAVDNKPPTRCPVSLTGIENNKNREKQTVDSDPFDPVLNL